MRRFILKRDDDETGVSGIGIVAEGIKFSDGTAVLRWVTKFKSLGCYPDMKELIKIHGHGGRTKAIYIDEKGAEY